MKLERSNLVLKACCSEALWMGREYCVLFSFFLGDEQWRSRKANEQPLRFICAVRGRWNPADTDDVRQDTYVGLSPGRCSGSWSWVWLSISVSPTPALFMLLSQPFISIFIPRCLILPHISCDGIGCSNDSLWGEPITEYRSSYWYQKAVERTSVLRSNLCMLSKTLANIHPHQNSAVKNKARGRKCCAGSTFLPSY